MCRPGWCCLQALGKQVMSRLREFSVMSDLKRLALVVLARTFNDNDVRRLKVHAEALSSPLYTPPHLSVCAAKLRHLVILEAQPMGWALQVCKCCKEGHMV